MSSAIVTGATGILGREIVNELASNPKQWPTVYALSHSKKEPYPPHVTRAHIDLTTSVDRIAKDLQNVKGEYIFFTAYLQQDSEENQTKVNGDMLESFLKALELNNSITRIKRFILVTGAKQYGVHHGAVKNPMIESDPWLPEPPFPPNFYYRQQRILHSYSEKYSFEWTVTYPSVVLGFVKGNFMNFLSSIAIYAAIHKELGEELPFPGSESFYTKFDCFTDSQLHAKFCAWAAHEAKTANQAFNVVNGDTESWQNLWPRIAKRFGLIVPSDQFLRSSSDASDVPLSVQPPLSIYANELGLQGRTPQNHIQQRIDLVKWSQKREVKEAWYMLAEREGLDKDALEKATWAFMGWAIGRNYDSIISMSKAREAGWTGYQDTWVNFEKLFDQLEREKILPPLK